MAIHVLALKNGLLVFEVYMAVLLKMLSKISANIWLIQKITKVTYFWYRYYGLNQARICQFGPLEMRLLYKHRSPWSHYCASPRSVDWISGQKKKKKRVLSLESCSTVFFSHFWAQYTVLFVLINQSINYWMLIGTDTNPKEYTKN